MNEHTASIAWTIAALRARTRGTARPTNSRLRGDYGEGVISAAIAVLIVAFLGALMWVGFQTMWKNTETRTNQQVEQIGRN